MRTVALEEHFSAPALAKRIDPKIIARGGAAGSGPYSAECTAGAIYLRLKL